MTTSIRESQEAAHSTGASANTRLIGVLLLALAAASIAAAFLWTGFREADGSLRTSVCLAVSGGTALGLLGLAYASAWRTSARWLTLAVVGQAAALQLVSAGRAIGYQHLASTRNLLAEGKLVPLILVTAQGLLVAAFLLYHGRLLVHWLRGALPKWQLFAALAVLAASSAFLFREPLMYAGETVLATLLQIVNAINIVAVAWTLPASSMAALGRRAEAWFGLPSGSAPAGIDSWPLACAAWTVIVSSTLACFSYERHPHVPDEVVYLAHARYLAEGRLSMPAPAVPDAFNIDLMEYDTQRAYSPVPPGWPAMLAAGALVRAEWVVNPILAGIAVLLTYGLVRELYDWRLARLVALLLSLSPWHLFLAMSYMTHTFALCCALAGGLAVAKSRTSGRAGWAWIGGMATGVLSLIRPLEGLVVAVLLGLWAIGCGGRRLKTASIAAFVLGTVAVGGVVLPYNQVFTGNAFEFPINQFVNKHYGQGSNSLGFGPNRGMGWSGLDPFPGHGWRDVVVNSALNLTATNIELLGWSTGSLILIAFMLVSRRLLLADWLMVVSSLAVIGIHGLYWFSGGPDFGARYWFLIIVPCLVLTARGMQVLGSMLASPPARVTAAYGRVLIGCLCLCLMAMLNFVPWRAVDKYYRYRGMRPDIRTLARDHDFGGGLVLIRGKRHPDYASAATYNPVDLSDRGPIYAWDRDEETRAQVVAAFSERKVWLVDGPSVTGDGYRVVAGPRQANQVPAWTDHPRAVSAGMHE